jgi:hypothetical protein
LGSRENPELFGAKDFAFLIAPVDFDRELAGLRAEVISFEPNVEALTGGERGPGRGYDTKRRFRPGAA